MKKIIINLFLWYLRTCAKIQLWKIKPKIIALTGSSGKTSLSSAIFSILHGCFKVKRSIGANSETGLPLDILGLQVKDYSPKDWLRLTLLIPPQLIFNWQKFDYYLAEMAVDDPCPPKNMSYLLSFIHPDIAIFLNVSAVHTQQFAKILPAKSKLSILEKQEYLLNAIAREKGKILTLLSKDKIGLANYDDLRVRLEAQKSKAKIYYFGRKVIGSGGRELKIIDYQLSLTGTEFTYQYLDKTFSLHFNFLLPAYYAYTFAAALQTGLVIGLTLNKATANLEKNFVLPPGRMTIFKGIKNTTIIDSSYNANKLSTLGALDLLSKFTKKKKKIFVFGDMRELGEQEKIEHERVAKKIITTVDQVFLVGPLTKKYIYPTVSQKLNTKWFKNSFLVEESLKKELKGKEVILIKGSQNEIFLEIVVEALLADKNETIKLCRRGTFWDRQRMAVSRN